MSLYQNDGKKKYREGEKQLIAGLGMNQCLSECEAVFEVHDVRVEEAIYVYCGARHQPSATYYPV